VTPSERKDRAIALETVNSKLAAGKLAKEIGVSRRTINTWRGDKAYQAAVRTARTELRAKVRSTGIADKDMRLRHANDEHKRLRAVILQRAKLMKDVPGGGDTGMLCVTYKMQSLGEGQGSEAKPEYAVDTALLERTQALREEVATAKGELKQRPKHTEGAVSVTYAQFVTILNGARDRAAKAKATPIDEHRDRIRPELQPGT